MQRMFTGRTNGKVEIKESKNVEGNAAPGGNIFRYVQEQGYWFGLITKSVCPKLL